MKADWNNVMTPKLKGLKIKWSCLKNEKQQKLRSLPKARPKTCEQSKNSEGDSEIIKDGIDDAEIGSKCVSVGKNADDQQNCAVNSIPLELKLNNSHSLKSKPKINSDLSSECLRTDECTILLNTEIQAMSASIVSTSKSKRLETKTQSLSQSDSKSNMLNQESN